MAHSTRLLGLPTELQCQIASEVDFPHVIALKNTCRHFYTIIPSLDHSQLLSAERTEFAYQAKLYSCSMCLRLRSQHKFADNMTKKRRSKDGAERAPRFCIECGLKGNPKTRRYTPGSLITVKGVRHAICEVCGNFEKVEIEDKDGDGPKCATWWAEKKAKEAKERHIEENSRAEAEDRAKTNTEPRYVWF
jgi:hypothetical protein